MDGAIIPTPDSERVVTTKRGLDITKVEWVIGREQEKDLALIHRIDQIQFFCDLPAEEKRQYNYKRKPSDPPILQSIWESHAQYISGKESADKLEKIIDEMERPRGGDDEGWKEYRKSMASLTSSLAATKRDAAEWFEKMTGLLLKAQKLRQEAMDRMFIWKKVAEEQEKPPPSDDELLKLAEGA